MNERLEAESRRLVESWMRHDHDMLGDYLVGGVEDPRINAQSILSRHLLIQALFGFEFLALEEQEVRFSAVMSWLHEWFDTKPQQEEIAALLHALAIGADDAEGLEVPFLLTNTYASLPRRANGQWIPNYLLEAAMAARRSGAAASIGDEVLGTFQRTWRRLLDRKRAPRLSLIEPACGSANDYRFVDAFGLSRFLDYAGFDLCEKNVANAKRLFPHAAFMVGNVFDIAAPDKSFDLCMVHDLFEHLSAEGLEAAVSEICRVTSKGVFTGFFNMDEIDDHVIRPVENYHWNTLSMASTRKLFERHGASVQVVHIDTYLTDLLGWARTHNKHAYTFVAVFKNRAHAPRHSSLRR